MKNLIVIIGTIILGLYIFNLLIGDGNSVKRSSEDAMRQTVEMME